jgi:hypothetical protein
MELKDAVIGLDRDSTLVDMPPGVMRPGSETGPGTWWGYRLFDETVETLQGLQAGGARLALLTSGARENVASSLADLDINRFFSDTPKPPPRPNYALARAFNVLAGLPGHGGVSAARARAALDIYRAASGLEAYGSHPKEPRCLRDGVYKEPGVPFGTYHNPKYWKLCLLATMWDLPAHRTCLVDDSIPIQTMAQNVCRDVRAGRRKGAAALILAAYANSQYLHGRNNENVLDFTFYLDNQKPDLGRESDYVSVGIARSPADIGPLAERLIRHVQSEVDQGRLGGGLVLDSCDL